MCKILKISRALVYYKRKNKRVDIALENEIKSIFKKSRNNYGSRKIKHQLNKKGYTVSIKKIRKIMDLHGLVSNYTVKQYKVTKATCNNDNVNNELNREFNQEKN